MRVLGILAAFALLSILGSERALGDITSVTRTGTSTRCGPTLMPSGMAEDALLFCDRNHQWNSIPAPLIGTTFVMTSNDDRAQADLGYTVEATGPGFLLLYIDNRVGDGNDPGHTFDAAGAPTGRANNQYSPTFIGRNRITDPDNPTNMAWMATSGFVDTGAEIGIDEGGNGDINQWFSIYALEIEGSQTVTLAAQNAGNLNNYLIGFATRINNLPRRRAPNGWIPTDQWNILGPLGQPGSSNPGLLMNLNQVAPFDIGLDDPQVGEEWDIEFGCAFVETYGGASLGIEKPTWFTSNFLETSFSMRSGELGNGDLVNYQQHIGLFINNNVLPLFPGAQPIPVDNVLYVATTYVENTNAQGLDVEVCTASDDSLQVLVNDTIVTNVAAGRGSAGNCQEGGAAVLPPGVSKITTIVWQGGGGHNFRLALRRGADARSDNRITDYNAASHGLIFHGATKPAAGGSQENYRITRSIEGGNAEQPSQIDVTLSGSGPGNSGDIIKVCESVFHTTSNVTISGAPPTSSTDVQCIRGVNSTGFVDRYLLSGPWVNAQGANPAVAVLQGTDPLGIKFNEMTDPGYRPVAGNLPTAAAGITIVGNPAGRNGSWVEFGGGNLNCDSFYGGNVDNNVVFKGFYVHAPADTTYFFGVGSDDSWTLRVDGVRVDERSVARGAGGPNDIQDFRGPFNLTAGTHFFLVGYWEGGGGHGGRAGLFNADRTPKSDIRYSIDPNDPGGTFDCGQVLCWDIARSALNGSGISYSVAVTSGRVDVSVSGVAEKFAIVSGDASAEVPLPALPYPNPRRATAATLVTCADGSGPSGIFDDFVDVGGPAIAGTLNYDMANGIYTQSGQGGDIWDGGDQFSFAYQVVEGNFIATARIIDRTDPANGSRWGKHGLMARDSCAPDSRYSMIQTNLASPNEPIDLPRLAFRQIHLTNGTNFDGMQVNDGTLPGTPPGGFGNPDDRFTRRPTWMRLIRTGNTVSGYLSFEDAMGNPAGWSLVGSHTDPFRPAKLLVGMALTSHSGEAGGIAYDSVSIEPFPGPNLVSSPGGDPVITANYDSEGDGNAPSNSFIAVRSGTHIPSVQGGRVRVTQDGVGGSATAVWYRVDGGALVNGGFEVEYDVSYIKPGLPENPYGGVNPADGGGMAVVVNGGDYLPDVKANSDFEDSRVIGRSPWCGDASATIDNGGGSYTSLAQTGDDIWDGGDTFEFTYNKWEGDFDIAVRLDNEVNVGGGRWGKYGLMARRSQHTASSYCMIQSTQTTNDSINNDNARFAGRNNERVGGGMFEDGGPIRKPKYLRLKRVGAVVTGWVSDNAAVEVTPEDDLQWTKVGRDYTFPAGTPACLYVGFANSSHNSMGCQVQQVDFTLINAKGTPAATACEGPAVLTSLAGDAGGAFAFDGGILRTRTETRPSFAIELDNWDNDGPNVLSARWNDPVASPNFDTSYHAGLDLDAWGGSTQTNVDFGGCPLPSIYSTSPRVKVRYQPTGQVDAWVNDVHAISARIPPLHMGAGGQVRNVAIGFVGGTGGASFTAEYDNLVVRPLCSETPDAVAIEGPTAPPENQPDAVLTLTAVPGGDDGGTQSYKWMVVSGPAAIVGADNGSTVQVRCTGEGTATVSVAYGDGTCVDDATATHSITCRPLGARRIANDCNKDGGVDISDPVCLLGHLFLGDVLAVGCGEEGVAVPVSLPAVIQLLDANGDNGVDISDPVAVLGHLFLGDPPPVNGPTTSCILIPGCMGNECPF